MTLSSSARRALPICLAVAAALAALLVASRDQPAQAAARTVKLTADPHGKLAFTRTRVTTRAGTVTLVLRNPKSAGLPHGIAIEGKGLDKDGKVVTAGKTSRVTVTLKRGTYEYYCPITAHKRAGMKGKLIVR